MQRNRQFALLAVLAVLAGGGWYYFGDASAPAERGAGPRAAVRTVPVQVAPARTGTVSTAVELVGTAQAFEGVTITSKVPGIVSRIAFEEGQKVGAGEVLVELDSSEMAAELEAQKAILDYARQVYQRSARLMKTENISQARLDELGSAMRAAEAKARQIEVRLADLRIVAPFAGTLGLRRVSVGALISPGTLITTIDDVETVKLSFAVPETALARLTIGLAIEARSDAYAGRPFVGKVTSIDSRVDPVTRSVEARAEFPNADGALKPGMFMMVDLVLSRRENAVLIAEEALVPIGTNQYVFTVVDGKAVRKQVQLGERLRGEVEVLSGIEAGAQIVIGGVQMVRDGSPVAVIGAPGATPAGGGAPGRPSDGSRPANGNPRS